MSYRGFVYSKSVRTDLANFLLAFNGKILKTNTLTLNYIELHDVNGFNAAYLSGSDLFNEIVPITISYDVNDNNTALESNINLLGFILSRFGTNGYITDRTINSFASNSSSIGRGILYPEADFQNNNDVGIINIWRDANRVHIKNSRTELFLNGSPAEVTIDLYYALAAHTKNGYNILQNDIFIKVSNISSPFENGSYRFGMFYVPNANLYANTLNNSSVLEVDFLQYFTQTNNTYYYRIDINATATPSIASNNQLPYGNVVCFTHDAKLLTSPNNWTRIIDVIADNNTIYSYTRNMFVPIRKIHYSGITKKIYLIKKDSLGDNVPNNDLYITGRHPVCCNGKIMLAETVPGAIRLDNVCLDVYTIATDEQELVNINNMHVQTWKLSDINDHIKSIGNN